MHTAVRAEPVLGVAMLDTRFPRLPGDVGNPSTWRCPVLYETVAGARVARVVTPDGPEPHLIRALADAVRRLEAQGAGVIATSCGFLGGLHARLQAGVSVPVVASALQLLPALRALYGGAHAVGVLTFDAGALRPRHFGPWYHPDTPIEGLAADDELRRVVAEDRPRMDAPRAARGVVAAARRLAARAPVAALLMECSNFGPYRAQVAAATARPVYDLNAAIAWTLAGLALHSGGQYLECRGTSATPQRAIP